MACPPLWSNGGLPCCSATARISATGRMLDDLQASVRPRPARDRLPVVLGVGGAGPSKTASSETLISPKRCRSASLALPPDSQSHSRCSSATSCSMLPWIWLSSIAPPPGFVSCAGTTGLDPGEAAPFDELMPRTVTSAIHTPPHGSSLPLDDAIAQKTTAASRRPLPPGWQERGLSTRPPLHQTHPQARARRPSPLGGIWRAGTGSCS